MNAYEFFEWYFTFVSYSRRRNLIIVAMKTDTDTDKAKRYFNLLFKKLTKGNCLVDR